MKRLLVYIISTAVLLVVADVLFGYLATTYREKYGLHGDYKPIEYVMRECDEDVLLIGSSVVLNSLMPSIIEDSLGMTCYNAGANSQTFAYYHTILNSILARYTPKMIILGVRPEELSGDGIGRYSLLVPYYHTGNPEIDSTLESKSITEKNLLKSNLYRYNTIWFRILLYHFISEQEKSEKGFLPHEKPAHLPIMTNSGVSLSVSENKVRLLEDIVFKCKASGVRLVVYSPPMYTNYSDKTGTIKELERVCAENDVPYYNDSQDSVFLEHPEWFYDNNHLNKYGALEYSCMFTKRLRIE